MKTLLLCMVALAAVHLPAAPLGESDARHLLARTGFGVSPADVATYARLDRGAAADKLLAGVVSNPVTPPPAWVNDPPLPKRGEMSDDDKKAFRVQQRDEGIELRTWWYREMLDTPSPLTERMTLFWHNHFVSAQQKVKSPVLLYRQNLLLRRYALGNFGTLLHEVARDPAMLIYLDGVQNRKGQPNENFAREVMELFTLGEGHYSEQDIREAARALTGMSLDRDSGSYRFRPALHDGGDKTIFGHTGDYDGDAFLDLILNRPETSQYIVGKLWREFISPTPDPKQVKQFAQVFRNANYELKPLLRAMLTSDAFYAPENRGVLVKSPVELTVGTFRTFGVEPPDWKPVLGVDRALGQDVFNPPNVKGWPGYTDWINSQTLLLRKQMLARVFRAAEMDGGQPAQSMDNAAKLAPGDKAAKAMGGRRGVDLYVDRWVNDVGGLGRASLILLPLTPDTVPEGSVTEAVSQLVMNPLYQLK